MRFRLIEIAQLYETKPKDFNLNIPLSTFLYQGLTELEVQILIITPEHAQRYYEIQPVENHKDPFDRTIIAQAASTGFTVLSDDSKFPLYPITVISNYD
ncbi:type II toxin-antitoxin system VapC family toxin [Salmonirosea aquatica]|uniref:PIN domain-containing protein n=1 Tax=Salmonirosea aquatica TaxID=2654236 RepID=A0A7C9FS22_9BACT|nr:PIN domain-containing protein [Cytophagaceae bacterium SJW1-29]